MSVARKLATFDDLLRLGGEQVLDDQGRWVEAGRLTDGDVARVAPFDAIELDVARLFPSE